MTGKAPLRSVAPGEKAPPKRKMTVAEAAATGSYKDLLVAQRERIAKTVDDPKCPPRDLAALTRRLTDIGKELDAIRVAEEQEAGGATATPDEEFDASAI